MLSLDIHHKPENISDRVALAFTKLLRFIADTFFKKKYGHRAVVLETVAAVPGMVGGMLIHLKSLRKIKEDKGWIKGLRFLSPQSMPPRRMGQGTVGP